MDLAHTHNFKDKIGLHLNLTWNKPLTDLCNTGLIDDSGLFSKKSVSNPSLFFSQKVKNKIKNEIIHQYRKLIKAGIHPTHIDSHHHIHTKPWIAPILLEVAKSKKIKVRLAEDRVRKNLLLLCYYRYLNNTYKKKGLNYSDKFVKINRFTQHSDRWINNSLNYEIMVHPVYKDGKILDNVENIDLEKHLYQLKENLKH